MEIDEAEYDCTYYNLHAAYKEDDHDHEADESDILLSAEARQSYQCNDHDDYS